MSDIPQGFIGGKPKSDRLPPPKTGGGVPDKCASIEKNCINTQHIKGDYLFMTHEQIEPVMGDPSAELAFLRGANAAFIEEIERLKEENEKLGERLETVGELRMEVEEERDFLADHGEKLIKEMYKIAEYSRRLNDKNLDLCGRIVKAMGIIAKARASIPVDHDYRNEWDLYMKEAFSVLGNDLFDQVELEKVS